jgi:NADPH-dependent curcumin reductase CurA
MEGMLVTDYAPRYPEGVATLARWMKEGSFKSREHVVEGFEASRPRC